jgi:hypothetical protein
LDLCPDFGPYPSPGSYFSFHVVIYSIFLEWEIHSFHIFKKKWIDFYKFLKIVYWPLMIFKYCKLTPK